MGHASVHARTTPRGAARWDLHYRLAGRQRSATFTNEKAALKWEAVFDAAGPTEGHRMLQATDPRVANAVEANAETVRQLVGRHVAALPGIEEGTRQGYLREANRDIFPTLGDLPAAILTRDMVAAWTNELAKRLSAKTISNRHGLLSAACARGVEDGVMTENPCAGLRLPRGIQQEMVILDPAEVIALADAVAVATPAKKRQDRPPNATYRDLALILAGTGLRWGEATALAPEHVRRVRGGLDVSVVRAWKDVDSGPMRLGPPKSKRGRRTIPLRGSSPVIDALGRRLKEPAAAGYLFGSPRGGVLRNGTFHQRVWIPAMADLAATGWTKRPRIHDLRHTAVSLMLAAGQDITAVSRLIGHEKTSTTWDVYGHLVPGGRESAMTALGDALAAALTSQDGAQG
jgi:integrase